MILVNNPGNWSATFESLTHADWNGCTLADLVFPPSSSSSARRCRSRSRRRSAERATIAAATGGIARRSAWLIVLGLMLNVVAAAPTVVAMRVPGVLQRIGSSTSIAAPLVIDVRPGWRVGRERAGTRSLGAADGTDARMAGGPAQAHNWPARSIARSSAAHAHANRRSRRPGRERSPPSPARCSDRSPATGCVAATARSGARRRTVGSGSAATAACGLFWSGRAAAEQVAVDRLVRPLHRRRRHAVAGRCQWRSTTAGTIAGRGPFSGSASIRWRFTSSLNCTGHLLDRPWQSAATAAR